MPENASTYLAQFRRFRVLLDALPQPAILKDRQGRIALANEAASRLWHMQPDELVGLTAGDLVDPASACWTEAADTLALHSSAPKLLRRRMKLRGEEQSFLVSIAPVYLTREERPDGIIVVVHPNGKDAPERAESADAIVQRQFAELALIKCELRDEDKELLEKQGLLDVLRLPEGLASNAGPFSSPLPDFSEGCWFPLKRLMKV
jgi:PAS domain S-box-containing protein